MNALLVGRICDVVTNLRAGRLDTARNLVLNTPGIADWSQHLSVAEYRVLHPEPAVQLDLDHTITDLVRRAAERFPAPPAFERCRSCDAPIVWGRTANKKSCPYNVRDGHKTSESHFATCPNARQHSTKARPH